MPEPIPLPAAPASLPGQVFIHRVMQSGETNMNTFKPPNAKTTGKPCGHCKRLG